MSAKTLKQPVVYLGHEDLPVVHQDIEDWATASHCSVEQVIRDCLYGNGQYAMDLSIDKAGNKRRMQMVPGSRWECSRRSSGKPKSHGPVQSDVMVIGKCLDSQMAADCRVYMGDIGLIFFQALRSAGLEYETIDNFYVATALLTEYLDASKSSVPKLWYESQKMFLMQQLILVKPRICLLQGSDVVKMFLGSKTTITSMESNSVTREFHDVNGEPFEVEFVASNSPAQLLHDRGTEKGRTFEEQKFYKQINHFAQRFNGEKPKEVVCDYVVVDNDVDLIKELERARKIAEEGDGIVAWDAEWSGEPWDADHYLRCIQFTAEETRGTVIALTDPGGEQRFHIQTPDGPVYENAYDRCARLCKKYMKGLRVLGHYFMADMKVLRPFGLDLYDEYDAAENWEDVETKGGVATEALAHAIDETGKYGLDEQLQVHTNIPRYSQPLEEYKKQSAEKAKALFTQLSQGYHDARRQLKKARSALLKATKSKKVSPARIEELRASVDSLRSRLLEEKKFFEQAKEKHEQRMHDMSIGYGWMSDEILYQYGAWDVAAELVLGRKLLKMVQSDRYGNDCRRAYHTTHRAIKGALEISSEGMFLDRPSLDDLAIRFEKKRDELLGKIREKLRWPDFNPNSRFQFAEALFGEELNGYLQQYGSVKRYRPPGARTLRAEPLRTTGKYPEDWAVVRMDGREKMIAPATSKQVLGEMFYSGDKLKVWRKLPVNGKPTWQLVEENHQEFMGLLRDYRFISQMLKTLVRPPKRDAAGLLATDDSDDIEYEAGITIIVNDDNRVRFNVRMTLETGRWATSPNLQNFGKAKVAQYQRIIGKKYNVNSRTILRALRADDPGSGGEDWYFVEQDYLGAELFVVAILSQDEVMIDHCLRNQLSGSDPDFFDIHSSLTVKAFGLDCEPTKKGLKSIGKAHLRVAGKCVAEGTRIWTDQGWISVEQLCDGLGPDEGAERNDVAFVNHVTTTPQVAAYCGGEKRCLRLQANDGTSLVCTPEHQIWTLLDDGSLGFVKSRDLKIGMQIIEKDGIGPFGGDKSLPEFYPAPLSEDGNLRSRKFFDLPDEVDENWAAFLGLHIAEGNVTNESEAFEGYWCTWQCALTKQTDPEFALASHSVLARLFSSRLEWSEDCRSGYELQSEWRLSSIDLASWLARHCGRSSDSKKIPQVVFQWPKKYLAILLRWLFEVDGSCSTKKKKTLRYSSNSEQLVRDVAYLCKLFGVHGSIRHERRDGYAGKYWTFRVAGESVGRFQAEIGFVSTKKNQALDRLVELSGSRDDDFIINQDKHLKAIEAAVGATSNVENAEFSPRRKLNECLRENCRVRLNRTRLQQILSGVDESKLGDRGKQSYEHLRQLADMNVRWKTLEKVEDAGVRKVYDVQTTDDFDHLVVYGEGGWLTHQSVVFGSLYQRGAKAIAVALRGEEGVFIPVEQAKQLQDTFFGTYNKAAAYLQRAAHRVHSPHWLSNIFGRYRRFPLTTDRQKLKAYEREATNAPIQGSVADAMNIAVRNVVDERDRRGMRTKLCLQVHDALQTHTPSSELNEVISDGGLLKTAMVDSIPVYVTDLDGRRLDLPPYKFGSSIDVYDHWGRPAAADSLIRNGHCPTVSGWEGNLELAKARKTSQVWEHEEWPVAYDVDKQEYFEMENN